jgi:hypothetical protein
MNNWESFYRVIEKKPLQSIMINGIIKTNETCYIKQRPLIIDDFYGEERQIWMNEEFITKIEYLEWRIMNE